MAPVSDVMQEYWKEHAIRIRTIPVRQIVTRMSTPDGYITVVRIDRNDEVLADWHLPRFSERWTRAAETQRNATRSSTR